MLVPSMTLSEIKKELEKDIPFVRNKGIYLIERLKHTYKTQHEEKMIRCFDYVTKQKNTWIIHIEKHKKASFLKMIAYFYGDSGLVAITPSTKDDMMVYYTAHFFKRYNERLNLNLTLPNDIIRACLDDIFTLRIKKLAYFAPGLYNFFAMVSTGYVLGTCDENQKFHKANTFITHDMLGKNQIEMVDYLNKVFANYESNATNLL